MSQHCLSIAILLVPLSAGLLVAENPPVAASLQAPAHQIDHFVGQAWNAESIQPAARCSDREFVRRLYVDLVGRVPSVVELENFLADGRENKRECLIDLLLASEDHVQHFADLFDALLMGRSDEGKYNQRRQHGWRAYLEDVFRSNRAWDKVAGEILLARPSDRDQRGAVWFLYERNNQHQTIAEAIAPAFFGIRIECAQCHDHMVAEEIKQAHYWGLVAFFNRSKNVDTKLGPRVEESAIGGFSEFANLSGESSPNVLTFFGASSVDENRPGKDQKQEDSDQLYDPSDAEGLPRVPKFSRRQRFVEDVLKGHPLLARAMVNRLWAIMLGRGIVHPYDEMDSVHKPSHPELLGWLSADFANSGFDVRRLVRSLALSKAYQLGSIRPEGADDPASFAWYLERPLTAEQLARSIQFVARGSFQNDNGLVKQFRQQVKDVLPDQTVVGIDDALFLTNGNALNDFLDSSHGDDTLLRHLAGLESHEARVKQMFLAAYGREPDSNETAAIVGFLTQRESQIQAALQQVLWSLMTSAEFQFNH